MLTGITKRTIADTNTTSTTPPPIFGKEAAWLLRAGKIGQTVLHMRH